MTMIGLINSVCITLLFSFWVWTLKQDINQLAHAGHDGSVRLTAVPEHKPVEHKGPVRRTESPLFDQHGKQRDKNGVATWTIG